MLTFVFGQRLFIFLMFSLTVPAYTQPHRETPTQNKCKVRPIERTASRKLQIARPPPLFETLPDVSSPDQKDKDGRGHVQADKLHTDRIRVDKLHQDRN